MNKFVLLLALLGFASGCTTTTGRFKMISTQVTSGTSSSESKVTGESCKKSILLVPYEREGNLEDAVDNAVQKVSGANSLIDVKVKQERLFTLFYNYRCIVVEGTAVQIK
jgi:uncharacterized protein YbjQ (UPF0145 family)